MDYQLEVSNIYCRIVELAWKLQEFRGFLIASFGTFGINLESVDAEILRLREQSDRELCSL